jgi:hypothetical protein
VNQFQKGDFVICEDASNTATHLEEGGSYEVESVQPDILRLRGQGIWWFQKRFRPLTAEPKENS